VRKAWEAVAIALYRQERVCSPTVNFGRGPVGYRLSSHNSAKIVAAGKRFRGQKCDEVLACHAPGVPPAGPLTGDVQAVSWGGHLWTPWRPIKQVVDACSRRSTGLYRIRGHRGTRLLYVGEGLIRSRLAAHLAKTGDPNSGQGRIFNEAAPLECSWVINEDWLSHQRLELEVDLIAAHVLVMGEGPAAQFRG
jgi:hypothetical protein